LVLILGEIDIPYSSFDFLFPIAGHDITPGLAFAVPFWQKHNEMLHRRRG
jgi:hypothetical protein